MTKQPCIKMDGVSYYIDTESKEIRQINSPENSVKFEELPEGIQNIINIFYSENNQLEYRPAVK